MAARRCTLKLIIKTKWAYARWCSASANVLMLPGCRLTSRRCRGTLLAIWARYQARRFVDFKRNSEVRFYAMLRLYVQSTSNVTKWTEHFSYATVGYWKTHTKNGEILHHTYVKGVSALECRTRGWVGRSAAGRKKYFWNPLWHSPKLAFGGDFEHSCI